jgi:predicted RecA/RadA family phage recombinase
VLALLGLPALLSGAGVDLEELPQLAVADAVEDVGAGEAGVAGEEGVDELGSLTGSSCSVGSFSSLDSADPGSVLSSLTPRA